MATAVGTGFRALVNRFDLLKVLKVPAAVARTNRQDAMRYLRLQVTETGSLAVTGMRLDLAVRTVAPVQGAAPGEVVVPVTELQCFATYSASEDLLFQAQDGRLRITGGDDVMTMDLPGPDSLPRTPAEDGQLMFELSRHDLKMLATFLAPVPERNSTRPWLERIHLQATSVVKATVTDGARVAGWEASVPVHTSGEVLVDTETVKRAAALANPGDTVRIYQLEHAIRLSGHHFDLWEKKMDASYPAVWKAMPSEYPVRVTLDKESVLDAIRMATAIARERAIRVELGSDHITLAMTTFTGAEVSRRLQAVVHGDMLPIAIDARVLLHPLRTLSGPDIEIGFIGPRRPFRVSCASQPDLVYVGLPLITY